VHSVKYYLIREMLIKHRAYYVGLGMDGLTGEKGSLSEERKQCQTQNIKQKLQGILKKYPC